MDKFKKTTRIHHELRTKAKAAKRLKGQLFALPSDATDPRRIGMAAATPKSCSCVMCGNYRKNGSIPFNELTDMVKLKEGVLEFFGDRET